MLWMVFNWQNLIEVVIILMVSGIKKKSLNKKLTIFVNMFQSHEREFFYGKRWILFLPNLWEQGESEQWRKMPSAKFPIRVARETGCLQLLPLEHPSKPMKTVRGAGIGIWWYLGQIASRENSGVLSIHWVPRCITWASQVVLVAKNLLANTGDLGSIPGSGRSPGEGHGNPLQHYCLETSMDRGAWQTIVRGVTKSFTW